MKGYSRKFLKTTAVIGGEKTLLDIKEISYVRDTLFELEDINIEVYSDFSIFQSYRTFSHIIYFAEAPGIHCFGCKIYYPILQLTPIILKRILKSLTWQWARYLGMESLGVNYAKCIRKFTALLIVDSKYIEECLRMSDEWECCECCNIYIFKTMNLQLDINPPSDVLKHIQYIIYDTTKPVFDISIHAKVTSLADLYKVISGMDWKWL